MRSFAWIFLLAGFLVVCEAQVRTRAKKVCHYTDSPLNTDCRCLMVSIQDVKRPPCPPDCSPFNYDNYSVCVLSWFVQLNAGWIRMSLDRNGNGHWNACKIDRYTC